MQFIRMHRERISKAQTAALWTSSAICGGLLIKKTEIMDRIKESVEQNGKNPELFRDIVRAAILLLERLIAKVIQKVMDIAKKITGKDADVIKEAPKETESPVRAEDVSTVQPEKEKMPFPVNLQWEMDMQNKTELLQRKTTAAVKNLLLNR